MTKKICIDSNCFSKWIDSAAGDLRDVVNDKPINFARERIQHLVDSVRPQIVLPTPVYAELLMISSISEDDFNEFIASNTAFVLAPYDVRAAAINAAVEKPFIQRGDKRAGAGQNETMSKLKFDRQILSIAKRYGVDFILTTDKGVIRDAPRYGVTARCLSTIEIPDSVRQQPLGLVVDNTK